MKKQILSILLVLYVFIAMGQNNSLVINNNAYVVLNGGTVGTPIYVVVDQANSAGITTLGTGGNIISEAEYNYVKWNISNTTGTYVVPFTTGVGAGESKIPLQVQITGAGTAGGSIEFSTYETIDNNTPWSSEVTHMFDAATGTVDNSLNVVDRFWQIEASSYATKPGVTLTFGYNTDVSETGGTNTLTVGNLGAQRFNAATNEWGGYFSGGSYQGIWGTDNGAGTVGGVVVPSASFSRTWVLSDKSSPLPIKLLSFNGKCKDANVELSWTTLSEINNDYFVINRSYDGLDFDKIGVVQGAGNSTSLLNYSYYDENPGGGYYRLSQVDFDGTSSNSDLIYVTPCEEESVFSVYHSGNDNNIHVTLDSKTPGELTFYLYDMRGKLMLDPGKFNVSDGYNEFLIDASTIATGMYNVVVVEEENIKSAKLIIH